MSALFPKQVITYANDCCTRDDDDGAYDDPAVPHNDVGSNLLNSCANMPCTDSPTVHSTSGAWAFLKGPRADLVLSYTCKRQGCELKALKERGSSEG